MYAKSHERLLHLLRIFKSVGFECKNTLALKPDFIVSMTISSYCHNRHICSACHPTQKCQPDIQHGVITDNPFFKQPTILIAIITDEKIAKPF